MKYRHAHHAGNFADVHKHVTLLQLLAALKRKEKGFLYLETHAGRGIYDLSGSSGESAAGIGRLESAGCECGPLREYLDRVAAARDPGSAARRYPGSPWLAVRELRAQDRAVLIERQPEEARLLERTLAPLARRARVEVADGFERVRALLPPAERRGLTFIDPPYEDTRIDFERTRATVAEALSRFATGIVAIWYPIKDQRDTHAWQADIIRHIERDTLVAELCLYPPDSRVALNGSGMLIVNPPYQLAERMRPWLEELQRCLESGHTGAVSIRHLERSGSSEVTG